MGSNGWRAAITAVLAGVALIAVDASGAEYNNQILVKFGPGIRGAAAEQAALDLGLELIEEIPQISWWIGAPLSRSRIDEAALEAILQDPRVESAERNQAWYAIGAPNDSLYSGQDGLRRMNIESAWDIATGSSSVVIAVSDSGVDFTHADLAPQAWLNTREVAGNGVDDDHNGYVDDTVGWDFVENDADPADAHSHGTHVSGILGAAGNDGAGVAGVNWDVSIMAVRFLDANGSGSTANGIKTITYAADNGAKVINMSWGGGGSSGALLDAINYGYGKGMLLLAAAGNNGEDTDTKPHYPSTYESAGLLSIASSQGHGLLSGFSNFGRLTVDFAAPGSSILSTVPGNQWARYSGTSMATPMAAGVAGLVLSKYPATPVLTLRNALLNAVVPRATYGGKLATEGDLDASLALSQFAGGMQVWPGRMTIGGGKVFQMTAYGATAPITWSTSNAAVATVDSSGRVTGRSAGEVTVTARDANGRTASTQWLRVVGGGGGGGGGGCGRGDGDGLGVGLPLVAGFLLLGRRRRKR